MKEALNIYSAKETPDPEIAAPKRRRQYSASYKKQILDEIEAASRGDVGKILRREGLTSSTISDWRRQFLRGTLVDAVRGRKRKSELEREIEALKAENAKLTKEKEKLEIIVHYQKKIAAMMGQENGENA